MRILEVRWFRLKSAVDPGQVRGKKGESMIVRFLHAVFHFFYEIAFGCSHDRLTRPFTLQRETYKVCLDCGKQIFYSPEDMRPLTGRELRRLRATQASEVKVLVSVNVGSLPLGSPQSGESNAA